ncbi:MAG: hypothetical protein PHO37_07310 [Kiritimatiellae bacterium]|nr:hypothetical protein [Kiritimatiellia bacterium]
MASPLVKGADWMIGQPIGSYLAQSWFKEMKADHNGYRYSGCTLGETVERFPWKKRLEWMPQDMPWQPPGKSVTLEFTPPDLTHSAGFVGRILLNESFNADLADAWKVHVSPLRPRSSFSNEGKAGEIMALPNSCVRRTRNLGGGSRLRGQAGRGRRHRGQLLGPRPRAAGGRQSGRQPGHAATLAAVRVRGTDHR